MIKIGCFSLFIPLLVIHCSLTGSQSAFAQTIDSTNPLWYNSAKVTFDYLGRYYHIRNRIPWHNDTMWSSLEHDTSDFELSPTSIKFIQSLQKDTVKLSYYEQYGWNMARSGNIRFVLNIRELILEHISVNTDDGTFQGRNNFDKHFTLSASSIPLTRLGNGVLVGSLVDSAKPYRIADVTKRYWDVGDGSDVEDELTELIRDSILPRLSIELFHTESLEIVTPSNETNKGRTQSGLVIYPNPCKEQVSLKYALDQPFESRSTQKGTLDLYDHLGKLVRREHFLSHSARGSIECSTADLPTGTYTVVLSSGGVTVHSVLAKSE